MKDRESGVRRRAGGAGVQQAAYVPSANRASCPAEGTILRAAGGRRSRLLPYLRCPSGEAAPRCGGKKAPAEARPAPGAGGRSEDRALCAGTHPAALQTGRKWEGGYRHLSATRGPGHGGPPSRPNGGAPLRALGVGVWGWGRGRCAHRAGRGRRGGAGRPGNLCTRRASGEPRPGKRQEAPTSDASRRRATQCGHGPPLPGRRRPRRASRRGAAAASRLQEGERSRPDGPSPAPTAAAEGSPHQGTGAAARNGTCEFRPPPAKIWSHEHAPQNQAKNLLNRVSHLRPHPSEERSILGTPAARAQPPHVPRRAHC